MAKIKQLLEREQKIYPLTSSDAVVTKDNIVLTEKLEDMESSSVKAQIIGELYSEANTVQLTKNGQPICPVTDASLVIGLNKGGLLKSVFAWDGESIPSIANIPEGVSVIYEASTYTGTLSPSADAVGTVYLVANGNGEFDKYIIDATGGSYTWKKAGTTEITSPVLIDDLETDDATKALSAAQGKVLDGKISQLQQNLIPTVFEDGFYIIDSDGNIGFYVDENGLSALIMSVLSTLFITTAEDGFYIIDSDRNIGFMVNISGAHSVNLVEY